MSAARRKALPARGRVLAGNRPPLRRGKGELLFVRSGVFASFFGGQNVESSAARIDGHPGHHMAVEVEPDAERITTG
jgi:hypothetical protein